MLAQDNQKTSKMNISVLVSGGGTNFQAIIDAVEKGVIKNVTIVQVISSSSTAYSLERAKKHGIKSKVIGKEQFPVMAKRTEAIIQALDEESTDLIILAGYMSVLEPALIRKYKGRIVNIHPSLIPKFCGKGFYGKKVHEAVLNAHEKYSGATVHYVDEGVDTGPIIMQEKVEVLEGDTVDTLASRVLGIEHKILVEAVTQIAEQFEDKKGGN